MVKENCPFKTMTDRLKELNVMEYSNKFYIYYDFLVGFLHIQFPIWQTGIKILILRYETKSFELSELIHGLKRFLKFLALKLLAAKSSLRFLTAIIRN